jgi:hypothetical protein
MSPPRVLASRPPRNRDSQFVPYYELSRKFFLIGHMP